MPELDLDPDPKLRSKPDPEPNKSLPIHKTGLDMATAACSTGVYQRWADRYFGPLFRCPADYRNVSGPADWKNSGPLEKIANQRQRTTEIELPLVRC
jgi:hypothetical protein